MEIKRPKDFAKPVKAGWKALCRRAKAVGVCRLGATAVEFGIVAPLFLSMALGLMETGRAMWIKASMQYAVERAIRGYMVDNTIADATLQTNADGFLKGVGVNVTVNFTPSIDNSTTPATKTLSATYTFEAIVPFSPLPDFSLTALSSVRKNS